MWNSYQRPDLLREEYDDRNVPTYDGDMHFYDRKEPILNHEAPPPWQSNSNSRRNPLSRGGFRDREEFDYDDRNNRDFDRERFQDRDARFYERRFPDDPPQARDRDDRRDIRDREPYNNNGYRDNRPPPPLRDREYHPMERHDDGPPIYRDTDFRGRPPPPDQRGHHPGSDIDYRNPNIPPPVIMRRPNERGPVPHPQANRFPEPNGNGPHMRPPHMIQVPPPVRPNVPQRAPPPRGPSGKGGLNWYS